MNENVAHVPGSCPRAYEAPAVEVVLAAVEQGFAGSDGKDDGGGSGIPNWEII